MPCPLCRTRLPEGLTPTLAVRWRRAQHPCHSMTYVHFCSHRARLGLRTQQFLSAWGTRSSRATWSGVPASLEQQFLRACKNAQL